MTNPVIQAAEQEVQRLSQQDLSDPLNFRSLQNAIKGLAQIKQSFAADPAAEMDEMLALDPSVDGPLGIPYMPMALPGRRQLPNGPETFVSRLLREAMAVIPQFIEQGKLRAEATKISAVSKSASSISELSFEIRKCEERGDTETANLLRRSLAASVERLEEKPEVTQDEILKEGVNGLQEVVKDKANSTAFGTLSGLFSHAINSGEIA